MKLQPNPIFAHRNFVLSSDNLSNCILNSGAIHEANSQAIIGWANVPPFFPCLETSLDKGTQRKTTENELPSLTQCTA